MGRILFGVFVGTALSSAGGFAFLGANEAPREIEEARQRAAAREAEMLRDDLRVTRAALNALLHGRELRADERIAPAKLPFPVAPGERP